VRRNQIVPHRTRVKNETHAILAAHLLSPAPHAELLMGRPGLARALWRANGIRMRLGGEAAMLCPFDRSQRHA
jgi:hypothetical protein